MISHYSALICHGHGSTLGAGPANQAEDNGTSKNQASSPAGKWAQPDKWDHGQGRHVEVGPGYERGGTSNHNYVTAFPAEPSLFLSLSRSCHVFICSAWRVHVSDLSIPRLESRDNRVCDLVILGWVITWFSWESRWDRRLVEHCSSRSISRLKINHCSPRFVHGTKRT
jgi:hypothetical protein